VLGKLGFVVTAVGLVMAFVSLGGFYGSLCVLAALAVNGTLLFFGTDRLSKSRMAVRHTLDGKVNLFEDIGLKVHDTGKAVTDLRPEGKAEFGEEKVTVWSYSGFIEANTEIVIIHIRENKIFVKAKTI
jgi:membrane-bound ClpP family serine protease